MIADMRKKVADEDKQYYVMQRRRNRSEDNFSRWFVKGEDPACRPIMDMEQLMGIEEHKYRGRPEGKRKTYMRVSSQGLLWHDVERLDKMKPMAPIDVRAAKEMKNFKVKIVDMGNACYTYKKYSSVI